MKLHVNEELEEDPKVETVAMPKIPVVEVQDATIKSVKGMIERRESVSPPGTPVRMVAHPGIEASGAAGFEEGTKQDTVPNVLTPEVGGSAGSQTRNTETERVGKVVRDAAAATAAAAAAALAATQAKKAVEQEKKVIQKSGPAGPPQPREAVAFQPAPISTVELGKRAVGLPASPSPRTTTTPQVEKPVDPETSKVPTPASQPSAAPKSAQPDPTRVGNRAVESKAPSAQAARASKPVEPTVFKTPPSPGPQPTPSPSAQFSVSQLQSESEIKEDIPSVTAVIARLSIQSDLPISGRTSLFVEQPSSRIQSAIEVTSESPRVSMYEVAPTLPLVISKNEVEEVGERRMSAVSIAPMLPALEQNIRFSFGDLS